MLFPNIDLLFFHFDRLKNPDIIPVRIKPLTIPNNVTCTFFDYQIEIKGPLGTLYLDNYPLRKTYYPDQFNLLLGLYNSGIQTAIDGVTYGHLLKLKVRGPGYKVAYCKNNKLSLRVGYSHMCHIQIPATIKVSFNKHNQIFCYSISRTELTAFVTRLKRLRRPNPFHAKGVFSVGQIIVNKASAKGSKKNSK